MRSTRDEHDILARRGKPAAEVSTHPSRTEHGHAHATLPLAPV